MIDMILRVAVVIACLMIGYCVGRSDGDEIAETRVHAAEAARLSEHNRIMQFIGVCKWAKIMAEDTRCKGELP